MLAQQSELLFILLITAKLSMLANYYNILLVQINSSIEYCNKSIACRFKPQIINVSPTKRASIYFVNPFFHYVRSGLCYFVNDKINKTTL